MTLARDLRKSHSDIVVEEDLASVLSRLRIEPGLEGDFKEAVAHSDTVQLLPNLEKVYLAQGAGPTVQHGLKSDRHMSAIIQLSMLSSFHSRADLANLLSTTM